MTIYETICDVNEKLIKKESVETEFKQDTICRINEYKQIEGEINV